MAVIATGFFDGVHIGHRMVVDTLVRAARERGEESVILTFWPHPRTVLQNDAVRLRLLNSLDEKLRILKNLGVDRVEVLPFTREFARMTAGEYFDTVVKGRYNGTAVLLGYDNRIGSDLLSREQATSCAREHGLDVIRTESVSSVGMAVSSTKIRKALFDGDVELASKLLCCDYSVCGVVVSGKQLGRTIGFPTANMRLYEPLKLIPSDGVYLTRVGTMLGRHYGMTNVSEVIETNIFDFDDMIYGQDITLEFISKVRNEMRFPSLEALREQLEKDRDACTALLAHKS